MKEKDTMKTAIWMLAVLHIVVAVGIVQAAAEKSPIVLFQEALYQEETEGDLDKAIELYQQVLDEAAEVRHLAARSLYQLGVCRLKKGEKDAAAGYFRKVVGKYPKQTSVVKKSKAQLDKIAPDDRVHTLVEDFFAHNYRDITSRKTLEWGEPVTDADGNLSIRYKYEATIWGKDKVINDEVFTFDANGDFVSVTKQLSPEELKSIVEKAVLTISTCAETDPRVKESLESLEGIQEEPLVTELVNYLDSETATIRRSAIYILWKGDFSDISAAQEKLLELCSHEENSTRGMAALALGEYKIAAAYDTLADMTLNDEDPFARRCGAYALGLLSDPKALPVLEQALQDPEDFVKQNARAAITMLTELDGDQSNSTEVEPVMTQETYNDIQPDGTIQFRNPKWVVNEGTDAITECRFINSDFVQLTAMTDEQGNPVEFTAAHEGNIYRYHVLFDPPVMPGETFAYTSEGAINGLVKPVANMKDTYRYHMTHSPGTGVPTLRIEEYLLPEGAELLSTLSDEMKQSEKDGRILLRIEKVIPAGGNLSTSFKYRLTQSKPDPLKAENLTTEGWKLWGQRKLEDAEAKFKEAIRHDPDNDNAYQGLGWAQLNQGKKENANASFQKCVKLNPQNSAALNGLGWIENGKGNNDVAIKWWEKAVRASNGVATASLSGLTQVYMDRQEYAKAAKYYQMWLKAEPNNEDAKAGLDKAKSMVK